MPLYIVREIYKGRPTSIYGRWTEVRRSDCKPPFNNGAGDQIVVRLPECIRHVSIRIGWTGDPVVNVKQSGRFMWIDGNAVDVGYSHIFGKEPRRIAIVATDSSEIPTMPDIFGKRS